MTSELKALQKEVNEERHADNGRWRLQFIPPYIV